MTIEKTVSATFLDDGTLPTGLFIDGEWRDGATGARIDVVDPARAVVFSSVADAQPADIEDALDAAERAAGPWASSPPRSRAEILRTAYEFMMRDLDRLVGIVVAENGKAKADAVAEIIYAADFFRWYAEEAVRMLGEVGTSPRGANRIMALREPIGIAVLVTPWNFPAAMATRKIGPALAAGCPAILKPASLTPLTALAIAEILQEAGLPPGVLNVLPTSRSGLLVSHLLHDPRVRALSFTGSTDTGRVLLREAADQVLKCSMELGGNAPFVILDDADVTAAVDGLMVAKMRNGGQACTAANRVYVHHSVATEVAQQMTERMQSLVVGPGCDPSVTCGPLIDADAVRRIDGLVQQAVVGGARVLCGGQPLDGPGYYYPPTVLDRVPASAALMREEIFGPVAAIASFASDEEVVRQANDTEYGLAAYVYSANLRRALSLAERIDCGMVAINRGVMSDPAAPFGGTKQSGLGREGGHDGLLEFTETKYIAVDW